MIDEQLQAIRPGKKVEVSIDGFERLHIMIGHSQIDQLEALLRANRVTFNTQREGIPFCNVEIAGDHTREQLEAILDSVP